MRPWLVYPSQVPIIRSFHEFTPKTPASRRASNARRFTKTFRRSCRVFCNHPSVQQDTYQSDHETRLQAPLTFTPAIVKLFRSKRNIVTSSVSGIWNDKALSPTTPTTTNNPDATLGIRRIKHGSGYSRALWPLT